MQMINLPLRRPQEQRRRPGHRTGHQSPGLQRQDPSAHKGQSQEIGQHGTSVGAYLELSWC